MDRTETKQANIEFHRSLSKYYRDQPFFRPENQERVRSLVSDLAAETGGGRLLDVGCGTGFILSVARDLFRQLDGVDITPEMIAYVERRPNVRVHLAAAEELPFRADSFDVAVMYSVLHHLPDLRRAFGEVRRVLRTGGVLYADESLSQHYSDALLGPTDQPLTGDTAKAEAERLRADPERFRALYAIDPELTRKAMAQNFQVRGLTEEKLRSLLQDAGFSVIDIRFRRFCGEHEVRAKYGEIAAEAVNRYLQSMLPLTRHLFKFFVLIAR